MISLKSIKQYLSLDPEFTDDDELLIRLLNSASNGVDALCNNEDGTWVDINDQSVESDQPSRVEAAILMLVAELYNNRELQTSGSLKTSPVFDLLLSTSVKHNQF